MEILVSDHTLYLSGYMDAVSKMLSTDDELFGLTAKVVESLNALEQELSCLVEESHHVESVALDFEKGISSLFEEDPRD